MAVPKGTADSSEAEIGGKEWKLAEVTLPPCHFANIAASNEPRIVTLEVTEDAIVAQFADGRTVSVPLAWSWRLANATPAQRRRFEIIGTGEGVHWPDIDEDISARGMLQGMPACPPKQARAKRRRA